MHMVKNFVEIVIKMKKLTELKGKLRIVELKLVLTLQLIHTAEVAMTA